MRHNGNVQPTELNLPDLKGQEPEDAKQQLRQLIRNSRDRLNAVQVKQAGEIIREKALAIAKDCHTIACYVAVNKEPPTLELIEELFQQGKRLLLPKLGPKLNRDWAYYEGLDDLADLSPDRPKEPSGNALDSSALAAVDLVIAPALAVDSHGNRLGQGGGWYDRALPYIKPSTPIYALCYPNELITQIELPTDQYDIPVTGVITPEHCYTVGGTDFHAED